MDLINKVVSTGRLVEFVVESMHDSGVYPEDVDLQAVIDAHGKLMSLPFEEVPIRDILNCLLDIVHSLGRTDIQRDTLFNDTSPLVGEYGSTVEKAFLTALAYAIADKNDPFESLYLTLGLGDFFQVFDGILCRAVWLGLKIQFQAWDMSCSFDEKFFHDLKTRGHKLKSPVTEGFSSEDLVETLPHQEVGSIDHMDDAIPGFSAYTPAYDEYTEGEFPSTFSLITRAGSDSRDDYTIHFGDLSSFWINGNR